MSYSEDRSLSVNAVDYTDDLLELEVMVDYPENEGTTTGAGNMTYDMGSKADIEIKAEFNAGFGVGEINTVLGALNGTSQTVVAKPKSGGVVQITGPFNIKGVPLSASGKATDRETFSVTWKPSGDCTIVWSA